MTEITWMKKTCAICPFSRTKTLGLHPDRAAEFADMANNPHTDFPCHKTATLLDDDEDDHGYVHGENSKTCHGFKTLQIACNDDEEGFVPDGDGFDDYYEMIEAHEEIYTKRKRLRK